jgi:nicotinamide riboside kinase
VYERYDFNGQLLLGLLGGPSTGKSTLADAIAEQNNGQVVEEQLKWYWEENHTNRQLTKSQLAEVARLQLREESNSDADILVSDTTPISTEAYSFYYHNESSDELKNLSSLCDGYDILILCDTDIPFEDDDVRSGDATRKEIQEHTKTYLKERI